MLMGLLLGACHTSNLTAVRRWRWLVKRTGVENAIACQKARLRRAPWLGYSCAAHALVSRKHLTGHTSPIWYSVDARACWWHAALGGAVQATGEFLYFGTRMVAVGAYTVNARAGVVKQNVRCGHGVTQAGLHTALEFLPGPRILGESATSQREANDRRGLDSHGVMVTKATVARKVFRSKHVRGARARANLPEPELPVRVLIQTLFERRSCHHDCIDEALSFVCLSLTCCALDNVALSNGASGG